MEVARAFGEVRPAPAVKDGLVQPLRPRDAVPYLPGDVPGQRVHLPAGVQFGVQQAGGGGMTAQLPIVYTPDAVAAHLGVSERTLRDMARQLGACRMFGNKMILTEGDVQLIMEAARCPSLGKGVPAPSLWNAQKNVNIR